MGVVFEGGWYKDSKSLYRIKILNLYTQTLIYKDVLDESKRQGQNGSWSQVVKTMSSILGRSRLYLSE